MKLTTAERLYSTTRFIDDAAHLLDIKPSSAERVRIIDFTGAQLGCCDTCGVCVAECPVNVATNRLQPRTLVRMANFGQFDELVRMPQVWYCISCNRCAQACPMAVKPAKLISHIRKEAIRLHIVDGEMQLRLEQIHRRFHRVRRHLVSQCLQIQNISNLVVEWSALAEKPSGKLYEQHLTPKFADDYRNFRKTLRGDLGPPTDFNSCFTCNECRNACPVCHEFNVFDPLWIFRMTTFGFWEELLASPAIWLCIACKTCTEACVQNVKGHILVRRLQEMALKEAFVDSAFRYRWLKVQNAVYPYLIKEIDQLLART